MGNVTEARREGEPRVGQRVRYREYAAVWNGRRGRSGQAATVVEVGRRRAGFYQVVVAPDAGGTTDTVMRARTGCWPRNLEPVA